MKIKVTHCIDCPFHQYEYDDWSTGHDSSHRCMLAATLKLNVDFIAVYDSKNEDDLDFVIETPDWCPLLNDKVEVEYEKNI